MIALFSYFIALLAGICAAYFDLKRRNLSSGGHSRALFPVGLDIAGTAAAGAIAAGAVLREAALFPKLGAEPIAAVALALGAFAFLWREGRRASQFQRPAGLVFGECLALAGIGGGILRAASGLSPVVTRWSLAATVSGMLLITWVLRGFLSKREEHRIIERIDVKIEGELPEYAPATPECTNPERWRMFDSMSAEVEVLEALRQFTVTLKPKLVVETGTFIAASTVAIAEGLRENGFGRVLTCEFDAEIFEKAKERIAASDVSSWIDCRNESSLEMRVEGIIDMFFSDSRLAIREQEIRRFLPQISPCGIILMHDTSSHYRVAREVAFRLEREGLISMVLLPTPRGLMIAQKCAGRK